MAPRRKACRAAQAEASRFRHAGHQFFTIFTSIASMMTLALALATYLAFNILVFLTYWWDKQAARKGSWRAHESTLLWLAFLGGSVGVVLAQRLLRHKTHKEPFRSYLLAIIVVQIGLILSLLTAANWKN
ncbi:MULTISPECIES: DUF1294 domain-containing protein [Rhizobium]|uniref:DUF1294 domain-containing protein n=1 Tax=Rhizobium TaxID=379 RepID=UPI0028897FCF|nr:MULTISPECIES: DUF1294 domain-containing protein [unclassified Rhizobium]